MDSNQQLTFCRCISFKSLLWRSLCSGYLLGWNYDICQNLFILSL
ncbi:hypothetical protein [Enterococcus phage PEF1]